MRKFGREGGGAGGISEFDLGHFLFAFHISQLVRNGSKVKLRWSSVGYFTYIN